VVAPVVGAFAEMSPGSYAMFNLIASVLAAGHCSFFNNEPANARGVFIQQLYHPFRLAAYLGWARILADR